MRWPRATALVALQAAVQLVQADDYNALACHPYSVNDTLIGGGPLHQNVLKNSCARIDQQSVFKNGSIWVSGGTQVYADWVNNDPVEVQFFNTSIGQNHYLIQTDMRETWDWKCNISQTAYDMSFDPRTNTAVPVVKDGAMFQGLKTDSKIWLFGGTTPMENTSAVNFQWPTVDQYSLWGYDMSTDAWQQADVFFAAPSRPSRGYSAEAPDKALAFWIGGAIDGGTSQAWRRLGNETNYLSGMLIFDFSDPAGPLAFNVSGPPWQGNRAGGLLQYVPNYGTDGVLVAIGGASKQPWTFDQSEGSAVNMTEIWIMDVSKFDRQTGKLADDAWYQQTATGSRIPESRVDSCVVGVPAKDGSSYQIYMYGGRWGTKSYDNTFALSIPQFVWTPIYQGQTGRYGHNCHLYKDWQMITVGGQRDPTNISYCDWESRGVAVYDLSQGNALAAWGSVFRTSDNPPPYRVPQAVYRDIGGNFYGGATQTGPVNGFANTELQTILNTQPSGSSGIDGSPGLSSGAIAGIVVGVVAFVVLVGAVVFILLRRGRRSRGSSKGDEPKSTTLSEQGLGRMTPDAELASETAKMEKVHEKDSAPQRFEALSRPVQELPGDVRYEVDGYATELIELPGESKYDSGKTTHRAR